MFSPGQIRKEGFFSSLVVELTCVAESFEQTLLFLNDIESLPYSARIMNLRILSEDTAQGKSQNLKRCR